MAPIACHRLPTKRERPERRKLKTSKHPRRLTELKRAMVTSLHLPIAISLQVARPVTTNLPRLPEALPLSLRIQAVPPAPSLKRLDIRARVSTPTADHATSTTHQAKCSASSPISHTTITSMETKDKSTHSNKNTRLKCANISRKLGSAHFSNTASSLMDLRSLDSPMM